MSVLHCKSCGTPWADHLGCEQLCAENQRLTREREEREEAARWLLVEAEDVAAGRDNRWESRWPWLQEKAGGEG